MERIAIVWNHRSKTIPLPNRQPAISANPDVTVAACKRSDKTYMNPVFFPESAESCAIEHQDGVVRKSEPNPAIGIREGSPARFFPAVGAIVLNCCHCPFFKKKDRVALLLAISYLRDLQPALR